MKSISNVIRTVGRQLGVLSPTARLLIGSLMVILAMSLFLVALYAGRDTMAPLPVDQLTPEMKTKVVNYLDTANVEWKEEQGRLMVPVERRHAVLAQLTESSIISGDQIDFSMLIDDDSPFRSKAQNKQRYRIAKMSELSLMVSAMSGIDRAKVVIDEPDRMPGIGHLAVESTATVSVRMTSGQIDQKSVDAIARLVSGAHAGMKVSNVQVIDLSNARSHRARSDSDYNSGEYLELKRKAEAQYRRDLEQLLAYIPGVTVAVNVAIKPGQERSVEHQIEDAKSGIVSEESYTRTQASSARAGEPGVAPNTGQSINSGGAQGSQLNEKSRKGSFIPNFPEKRVETVDYNGYPLKVDATILVPRSYYVEKYRAEQGDDQVEPDAAYVQAESDRIQQDVMPLIDTSVHSTATPGVVRVSMIPDSQVIAGGMGLGPGGETVGGEGGLGEGMFSEGVVRYVGLGGLALLSLAMMFLMVRKANAREELPTAEELVGVPPALQIDDSELVGEADETDTPMEGLEVDEVSLKQNQVLEQINDMVKSEPEDAAALLRKWMRSDS